MKSSSSTESLSFGDALRSVKSQQERKGRKKKSQDEVFSPRTNLIQRKNLQLKHIFQEYLSFPRNEYVLKLSVDEKVINFDKWVDSIDPTNTVESEIEYTSGENTNLLIDSSDKYKFSFSKG